MTLRTRLLLAQGPLALALALVGLLAQVTLGELGRSGQRILKDNYRSVLAAQRMKEALERLDSAALFLVIGETTRGQEQLSTQKPRFEQELVAEEGNFTEVGEAEATSRLRAAWMRYGQEFDAFQRLGDPAAMRQRYLETLGPTFVQVKGAAEEVLSLNQDAMVRKSEALRRQSEQTNTLIISFVLLAFAGGVLASVSLTHRALRPVGVLSQAVRRVGQGDLDARARVDEKGEIGQLAEDFNAMAAHLKKYRQSSLGELLQAQQSSQAAIDSLPDPVAVFGLDGKLINVNQAAESILGLKVEAEGEALVRGAPEAREVLERVHAHVLGGKGPYVPRGFEEAIQVHSPEGPRYFLPRASPVYGEESGVVGATVVLQDVTRLRRFDELKNDLVATVAHEFRTPLTSLRMAIHLCTEEVVGPLTEKQKDVLFAGREDCERLQGIVDDLLDLSRIQAGKLVLSRRAAAPAELLEDAIAPHRSIAQERGVSLSLETPSETLPEVEVDPERLGMVLGNLVANAVRHTPSGGEVKVRAAPQGDQTRFEVVDTGEGIAPEHLEHLFERFYQVAGTGTGSAGLGLSIAQEIVRAHGGRIGVDSTKGRGSRFWFTVPNRAPPPT